MSFLRQRSSLAHRRAAFVVAFALGLAANALMSGRAAASTPAVEVRGETSCPSAAELSAALAGLVAPAGTAAPDVAELRGQGALLSVRLSSAEGEVIAERMLPTAPTCGERARSAAVIVAAWEARLRAGRQGDLPLPTTPPPALVVPPAAAPPKEVASNPPATVAGTVAPPAPKPPLEFEPGVALLASVVAGHVAPGALAEVVISRHEAHFALGLGALVVDTHETAIGGGQATWRRFGGVIDARARSRLRAFALELRAGLVLAALSVDGRSLPQPAGATLFDAGTLVGLRGKVRVGPWSPWIDLGAAFWPGSHTLYMAGTTAAVDVPSAEALLGLGVSF